MWRTRLLWHGGWQARGRFVAERVPELLGAEAEPASITEVILIMTKLIAA
jgi:hypothetical protein